MTEIDAEFPIVCETCLGDNPFVRMTKEQYGKACKICDRPFTVFRWRPGARARFKKTEICQTCAKMKNVCQTCILDLAYGLPVQVRDSALEDHEKQLTDVPKSSVNRDYMFEQFEKRVKEAGGHGGSLLPYGKAAPAAMLQRLTRRAPYYDRNRPHICSFYVKGECSRGDECPYRHEDPVTGELANQNIKDRFYGVNDPVAKKMLREHDVTSNGDKKGGPRPPPEDKAVTTLFVGGVDNRFSEDDIREKFSLYGVISSITMVPLKGCAFITYCQRDDAEKAVNALHDTLVIHGTRLRVDWGKSRPSLGTQKFPAPPGMGRARQIVHQVQHDDPSKHLNLPQQPAPPPSFVPPPPGMSTQYSYPSMHPNAQHVPLAQGPPPPRRQG